jgi:hypothetical protein
MCLKFREEIINTYALVNLIDDDYGIDFELSLFTSNVKLEEKFVMFWIFHLFLNLEKEKLITCF